MWKVEYTELFEAWWQSITEPQKISVDGYVGLLEEKGPALGFPHSSGVIGSKHSRMRELRVQHKGKPLRVLYAFDPRRVALLLLGGDKTGDKRWYLKNVPTADRLYAEHLDSLDRKRQ